ncbi:hypothetical protein BX616_007729 [Lobosporangium transversale]|nr:hypothetical protein BX616_007729 [Lobosporangium transversale]
MMHSSAPDTILSKDSLTSSPVPGPLPEAHPYPSSAISRGKCDYNADHSVIKKGSAVNSQQHPAWFRAIVDIKDNRDRAERDAYTRLKIKPASVGNLVWYSTTLDPKTAVRIHKQRHVHHIKYVIPDLSVQMYGRVQKYPPNWGLDRIDQRNDRLDGLYHYPASAGQNVTIYIIDTGVNIEHKDFEGRAQHGPTFVPGTDDQSDRNGHGTFVAAVAAGTTFGVAKKARVVSLKALDNAGSGRLSNVLSAIEWVVKQHLSQGASARSVINLSLGAEYNELTNIAIQEAMKLGIHFSIAAGNDSKDACQFSPASTPGAVTVGATDQDDTVAHFSNWGPCVAIYAPGTNILSAWTGSNSANHVQSGTSMASPHVAGLMALLLSESPKDNIPVRTLAKMILKSGTSFSLNGQSTVAGTRLSHNSSLSPSILSEITEYDTLKFHGKVLARKLLYVDSMTPNGSNSTDIEDPPMTIKPL